MSATIRDVAREAGVSITTVSRVLNDKPGRIREDTQELVRDTARALGYEPNRLGVGLRLGTAPVLGLVIPDVRNAYFHDIIRGVEAVTSASGLGLLLTNTGRSATVERAAVDSLLAQHVSAILFAGGGVEHDDHLRQIDWGSTRVLGIGHHSLPIPLIDWDQQKIAELATEHLWSKGCERIAYVGGQPSWQAYGQRITGYRRCLEMHGVHKEGWLEWPGDPTAKAGAIAVRSQICARRRFDGVVAFSDYVAYGAIAALGDAGLSVRDVKVIGCDDVDLSSYVRPTLSTIRMNAYEVAKRATSLVLGQHEDTEAACQFVQPSFELVERGSTSDAAIGLGDDLVDA